MTMLTEDEAKTKWCPYVQISAAASGSQSGEWYNRPHPGEKFLCIASGCMAWRTDNSVTASLDKHGELLGYCGAFGKVSP